MTRAVQIVQIGRCEATAIKRHERTQVRRQHRQDGHDHPFGLVAGLDETFQELQALGQTLQLRLRRGARHLLADLDHLDLQVDGLQQFVDGLGTHAGVELIAVLLDGLQVQLIGEQLPTLHRRHARLDDHEGLEVQHALDLAQRHVQHQTIRDGSDFKNQMCAVGLASSMWPMRSRRTFDWVTSTPHFSHTTPRCFKRLYLPHRHS